MPNINLYNQDCMDFMKGLPDKAYELAIVDPPYGNGSDVINIKNGRDHLAKRSCNKGFENKKPLNEYFSQLKRVSKEQIVWGGNFFGLEGGYICWNKNGTVFGEAELAYCSMQKSVSIFEFTWNGMLQGDMLYKETRIHPTQKPVALYKWLLRNYAKPGDKILDTHGGSGSIAIACYDLGFDLDWMELDKDYFEAAVSRYESHVARYAPASEIPVTKKGEIKLF